MTVSSSPHRSVRSTRGSGYGGEDDYLYDSIPVKVRSTRESHRSAGAERGRQAGMGPGMSAGSAHSSHGGLDLRRSGGAGIGLVVTGDLPHTVQAVEGLVDQVSFSHVRCMCLYCITLGAFLRSMAL